MLAGALAALAGFWASFEAQDASSCAGFRSERTEVWLALGQSNAANHAQVRMAAGEGVGAFERGRCLAAQDPLPGGDGEAGSVWTPLADAWVKAGASDRVLVAVTAKSATQVADWQPGGSLHRRASRTIADLQRRGLKVTRIFWLQGEADAILGTSGETYGRELVAALEPLSRAAGAPVFIPHASQCGEASSSAVREAQARVIARQDWALPGPDLDRIGPDQRYERCHYARSGQMEAVRLWLAALEAAGNVKESSLIRR